MTDPRGPNLFLLGAAKCGTTSLAACLDRHPGIAVSEPKEPRYYSAYADTRRMTIEDYAECFARGRGLRWRCDASPDHLEWETSIRRIADAHSDARFIVMVRDLAEMALSLFHQQVYSGVDPRTDFADAWARSGDFAMARRVGFGADRRRLDYRRRVSLGTQLSTLFRYVDRERVLLIELEALRRTPTWVIEETFAFLDLPPIDVGDMTVRNERKTVRHPRISRLVARAYGVKRQLGVQAGVGVGAWLRRQNLRQPASGRTTDGRSAESSSLEAVRDQMGRETSLVVLHLSTGPAILSDARTSRRRLNAARQSDPRPSGAVST